MTHITLKASLKANKFGGGHGLSKSYHFNELGLEPCEHAKLTYAVRLPQNAALVLGGKLPGLASASSNEFVGGRLPKGNEGWSMRMMFHTDEKADGYKLSAYPYLPLDAVKKITKPSVYRDYGGRVMICQKLEEQQNPAERPLIHRYDRYRKIEQTIQLNAVGKEDGVLELRVNDELLVQRTDVVYRTEDNANTLIGRLMLSVFFGGDASWVSTLDQTINIDIADLEIQCG